MKETLQAWIVEGLLYRLMRLIWLHAGASPTNRGQRDPRKRGLSGFNGLTDVVDLLSHERKSPEVHLPVLLAGGCLALRQRNATTVQLLLQLLQLLQLPQMQQRRIRRSVDDLYTLWG